MNMYTPTIADLRKVTHVITNMPAKHRPIPNKPNMFDIILSRSIECLDGTPNTFCQLTNTLTKHKLYYNPKYNQVTFIMPTKPNTIWLDENGNPF